MKESSNFFFAFDMLEHKKEATNSTRKLTRQVSIHSELCSFVLVCNPQEVNINIAI